MNQPVLAGQQFEAIKKYFTAHPGIAAAYLYGSFARGNTHPGSDIDIAILFSQPATSFEKVGKSIMALVNLIYLVRLRLLNLILINHRFF